MKRIEELTHDQQWVYYSFLNAQILALKQRENRRSDGNIYRWIHTRNVAEYMDQPISWVRYRLKRVSEYGLIMKLKSSGQLNWSCSSVEGYKDSTYKDYLTKIKDND